MLPSPGDLIRPGIPGALVGLLLALLLAWAHRVIAPRRPSFASCHYPPRGCHNLGASATSTGTFGLNDEFAPAAAPTTGPVRIKALLSHPIKSCAAVELAVAPGTGAGLAFDRAFCLAEQIPAQSRGNAAMDEGEKEADRQEEQTGAPGEKPRWAARTMRDGSYSKLTLIQPELWLPDPAAPDYDATLPEVRSGGVIVLRFPRPEEEDGGGGGMGQWLRHITTYLGLSSPLPDHLLCSVPLTPTPDGICPLPIARVRVWSSSVAAYDYGAGGLIAAPALAALARLLRARRPLSLFRMLPAHRRAVYACAPRHGEAGLAYQPHAAFADMYPLSVQNLASVRALADMIPPDDSGGSAGAGTGAGVRDQLTVRRFRPNIVVTGAPPFDEESWKLVTVAPEGANDDDKDDKDARSVDLHITSRIPRCRVPNVNPATGVRDARQPDVTLRTRRNIDAGDPGGCLGMHAVPAVEGAFPPLFLALHVFLLCLCFNVAVPCLVRLLID